MTALLGVILWAAMLPGMALSQPAAPQAPGAAAAPDLPPAPEAQANGNGNGGAKTVSINFDGVDIRAFIKYISQVTGKNFVIDETVKGTVTVISPHPLSLDEAYKVFESVLEVNGFTCLPSGKFTKVVPSKTSRSRSMETVEGKEIVPSPDDRMVTQVISLRNIRTPELRKVLTPMVSPDGLIADYADTNTLIVTDYRPNIQRLINIINQLDVSSAKASLALFPLKHSSAAKLSQKIEKLLAQDSAKKEGGGAKFSIIPEERTNSLIVLADPEYVAQIKTLLAKLDIPNRTEQGNLHVYRLQHADAENLSKVLNDLFNKAPATSGAQGGEGAKAPPSLPSGFNFVADKTTNSLLVTATPEDIAFVDPIVAKLDLPRKQVYVEALIMEVSADKAVSFGVNLNGANQQSGLGDSKHGGLVFGSSNPSGYSSLFNSSGGFVPPPGLALGAIAFPVKIGDVVYSNLQAVLNASKTDNNVNIIAAPQLMTLDNEEATIIVAENRPFVTSQDLGKTEIDRPYQRYDYKDVGTTLKVTPQINEGENIKLKIKQETSRVDDTATQQTGALQATTRKRTTETTVLVPNGQTIALSGLIGKTQTETNSKTPGLGDVPVLGWLFKNKTKSESTTNLYVFITPTIAATRTENEKILHAKSQEIEQQIPIDQVSLSTPIRKAPVLFSAEGRE